MEKDIGSISELAKSKEGMNKIGEWLKNNVHKHSSIYLLKDLLKESVGDEMTTSYFLDYLNDKYKKIY